MTFFKPALECLEDRAVPSTMNSVASPIVARAADVPQPVDFPDVFTNSYINVPQNATIASVKVQLNITYPLDNDLTIDLIAPDGTDVSLSSFEGYGSNFQNTIFDDKAVTPITFGASPFAGSYRPETALSALAGKNIQGTWELEIVDWGGSSGTLNSWSLIVQPAGNPTPTASGLTVSGLPSAPTAGQTGSVTVTARDASGNVATGYTGTVHFTSSDPQAGLPADYTFTAADAGTHTFSTTLKTAGNEFISATDTVQNTLTSTGTVMVIPAAADHLVFGQQPTNTAPGAAISPAVTVRVVDAYNNLLTGDNTDSVNLALGANPGGGTLQGVTTATVHGGIATFSGLSVTKPGNGYTLVAHSGSLTAATSASFAVATSSALVFNSTDLPQTIHYVGQPGGLIVSLINVPQNVSIASVKVQVNITYPRDSDLVFDLIAPGYTPSDTFQLSAFYGNGANFQNTIFDSAAAMPITAGAPPFAGSYRPVSSLSPLAGRSSQGIWELEVADLGGNIGTFNSWSLIIQPAGSPTSAVAPAAVYSGTPLPVTVPSPSLTPVHMVPLAVLLSPGNTLLGGQVNPFVTGPITVSDVPRPPAFDDFRLGRGFAVQAEPAGVSDAVEQVDAGNVFQLLHLPGHHRRGNG
jgi:subtilisin-like proprotein convertase family protein